MQCGASRPVVIAVYDESGNYIGASPNIPNVSSAESLTFDSEIDRLYLGAANTFPGDQAVTEFDLSLNGPLNSASSFPGPNAVLGIAFDSFNVKLYAVGSPPLGIHVYDESGNPQTTTGTFPGLIGAFGIAFDPSNRHLYATNAPSVSVYDENGNPVSVTGAFCCDLSGPIAFDSNNNRLYVSANGPAGQQSTIRVFDENGNAVSVSGTFPGVSGAHPGLDSIAGIAFDAHNNHLYVTDRPDNTVLVFDENGNQLSPSGGFPHVTIPTGIAVAP